MPIIKTNGTNVSSKPKVAILLRGFHYYEKVDFFCHRTTKKPFDYRKTFPNFKEMVLDPLLRNSKCEIYVSTYHSPIEDTIIQKLKPKRILYNDLSNKQIDTLLSGLEMINKRYDRIFIFRMDLIYKIPIHTWNIPYKKNRIHYPWKEVQTRDGVSDMVIIIDGSKVRIMQILEKNKNNYHKHMHFIGNNTTSTRHFMFPGWFCSNTRGNQKNPLFDMSL